MLLIKILDSPILLKMAKASRRGLSDHSIAPVGNELEIGEGGTDEPPTLGGELAGSVSTKLYLGESLLSESSDAVIFLKPIVIKSNKYKIRIKNKHSTKDLEMKKLVIVINYLTTLPLLVRKIPMSFFQNTFDSVWNTRKWDSSEKKENRYIKFSQKEDKLVVNFDREFSKLYGFEDELIGKDFPIVNMNIDNIDIRFKIRSVKRKPTITVSITLENGKFELQLPGPNPSYSFDHKKIDIDFTLDVFTWTNYLYIVANCKLLNYAFSELKRRIPENDPFHLNSKIDRAKDSFYLKLNSFIPQEILFCIYKYFMGTARYTEVYFMYSDNQNIYIEYTDYIADGKKGLLDTISPESARVVPKRVTRPNPVNRPNTNKVDHIVVVMMENRSFDHYLGYLSLQNNDWAYVNGLTGEEFNKHNGKKYKVSHLTNTVIDPGPGHETENMLNQMRPGNGMTMSGFVDDYAARLKNYGWDESTIRIKKQLEKVMGYYTEDELPVCDYLAKEFAICNKWFCSHPGPTLTNRFITLTGNVWKNRDGQIFEDHPQHVRDFNPIEAKTIFDCLTEHDVSWNYFEKEYCTLRLFGKYTFDNTHIIDIDKFYKMARKGTLPAVSFIDPDFIDLPPGNDDHPPTDIKRGQKFLHGIIKALQQGRRWNKTLLLITYDESGGFYDHVPPEKVRLAFDTNEATYGPRVPTFVVSPRIPLKENRITVSTTLYDHTSIGATILRKFCSKNVPILSQAMNKANDVWDMLSLPKPRKTKKIPDFPRSGATLGAITKYEFDKEDLEGGFHHLIHAGGFFFRG